MKINVKNERAKGDMLVSTRKKLMADFNIIDNSVVLVNMEAQRMRCLKMFIYLKKEKSLNELNKLWNLEKK